MSVLGGIFTGNSELDPIFTLIDEKLSELYSLHGAQLSRGTPVLSNSIQNSTDLIQGADPNFDNLYRNLIPRAIGYSSEAGELLWGINLRYPPSATVAKTAVGLYNWFFIRPPADLNYVVIAGLNQVAAAIPSFAPTLSNKTINSFVLHTLDSTPALADHGHYISAWWA